MSTTVFSFTVGRPYLEDFAKPLAVSQAGGGRRVRRKLLLDAGRFRVYAATIQFPRNTLSTFEDFWEARHGGYDSFLYLPVLGVHKSIADEAVGTGDGVETDFALDSKHIKESTLVVKVNGAVVSTNDWDLTGNDTAPIVEFDTAPTDTHPITASYDRYIPCVFDQPAWRPNLRSLATTDAASVLRITALTWSQDRSGSHLV